MWYRGIFYLIRRTRVVLGRLIGVQRWSLCLGCWFWIGNELLGLHLLLVGMVRVEET